MSRLHRLVAGILGLFLVTNLFAGWVSFGDIFRKAREQLAARPAQALSVFTPTAGNLVVGTNLPITSNTSAGNVGSWRGTLAIDTFTWTASSTASGLDQQLSLDGSQLNNANTLIVTLTSSSNSATLSRIYQICDWTSSAEVDNAADAQCAGGGWRTLNVRKVGITTVASTNYTWHLYNGYWSTAANANVALNTPLSNFIRSADGEILVRSFSTTNCTTCTHSIDALRVESVIDPIYSPSGAVTTTASTFTNGYKNAQNALWTGQSGSDNSYFQAQGTASVTADFYMRFTDVRTAPGMNAIVVRAEYSCSTTGLNHRPKIWNFTTGSWEDLTATSIACSATDATAAFAKGNVTLSDYVSGGEIRVGWRGLSNSTVGIRIDQIYVMVGSVNSDASQCEISFGTGTASNCANTRDIDTTLATPAATWQQTSELESATMSHDYYSADNDFNANANHISSANLWIPASVSSTTRITGLVYASNLRSNATTMTVRTQFKDFSGANPTASGGWTNFGTTNAAVTYTYQDTVTNGYFASNPDDYVDTISGKLNVRIPTSASTAAAAIVRDIDFVFASVQWTETTPTRYTLNNTFVPEGGTLAVGTENPIVATAAAANTGSWKGTLAADTRSWTVSSTASGLDQQLYMDDVQQNNANKLIVTMSAASNNTTLSRVYQICDWSSAVDVDNAADAQCTGGGWRTLNVRKVALTTAANTSYVWHVYNGYWNSAGATNTPLSTPVSNFIKTANGRVLIRAFSTTNCTTCTHSLDYLRVDAVIDSVYLPAGLTTTTAGTVTGDYRNAENALFAGQSGSDNARVEVAGTGSSAADFYFTFQDVRTYASMNAILVRAEYSCSTTGLNHRPKIWNFTSGSWEDLTPTSIACSATDATAAFAKGNVTVTDYVSNGQMRIGWRGLSNSTVGIRIDQIYVMVGSVNSDAAQCEISFGTGTASNCVNTRDLDTTLASPVTWQQSTEAESAAMSHDYYASDNNANTTAGEHAASANLWISSSLGAPGQVIARLFAANFRSNSTTITAQGQLRDMTGANPTISGGWTNAGTTNLAVTYTYTDNVISGYFGQNPEDYVDTYNGRVNFRLRTSVGASVTPTTRDIDFVFVGLQWVEPPTASSITLTLDSGSVALGSIGSVSPVIATSTASVLAAGLSNGYQLLLDHDGASSTLLHTDAVTAFPDYADWDGSGNATSTPGSTLSFRVNSSTANFNSTWWGSGTPLYAGIPAAMTTIMSCASCTTGSSTTTVQYRILAPVTQKTGTYNGTSTFTALSLP